MFIQLGSFIFDANLTPTSFEQNEDVSIVEHSLVNRKNLLQFTGLALKDISMSITLRQDWCNVRTTIDQLNSLKNNFTVLPLLWGYGILEGDFVITSMPVTHLQQLNDGTLIAAAISLRLREYATDDKMAKAEQTQRNSAIAVGITAPTLDEVISSTPGENEQTASTVSVVTSNAGTLDEVIKQYANTGIQNNNILANINNVLNEVNKVKARIENPLSGLFGNSALLSTALNVSSTANSLDAVIRNNIGGGNDTAGAILGNGNLQDAIIPFTGLLFTGVLGSILRL